MNYYYYLLGLQENTIRYAQGVQDKLYHTETSIEKYNFKRDQEVKKLLRHNQDVDEIQNGFANRSNDPSNTFNMSNYKANHEKGINVHNVRLTKLNQIRKLRIKEHDFLKTESSGINNDTLMKTNMYNDKKYSKNGFFYNEKKGKNLKTIGDADTEIASSSTNFQMKFASEKMGLNYDKIKRITKHERNPIKLSTIDQYKLEERTKSENCYKHLPVKAIKQSTKTNNDIVAKFTSSKKRYQLDTNHNLVQVNQDNKRIKGESPNVDKTYPYSQLFKIYNKNMDDNYEADESWRKNVFV